MKKKTYRYPAFVVSASDDDLVMIKELREKYHVIISPFIRDQLRKLHKKLKRENKE